VCDPETNTMFIVFRSVAMACLGPNNLVPLITVKMVVHLPIQENAHLWI
jgi:hypothetical protein